MSFGFVCFYFLNFLFLVDGLGELQFVTLVFRHGDRAPEGFYPKDPYKDVSRWPNGWGQLTRLGKLQMYELGKWIRHRYWDFLPIRYNASDIYARSTDVDRTLVSAYCFLAGLYECRTEEENDGLAWQPVPVHTTPLQMDAVLAARKECPTYDCLLENALNAKEVSSANEFYPNVLCNLSLHSGLQIKSVADCTFLYSTLNIQDLHGLELPEWTKNFFPQPLKEIVESAFKLPCSTPLMKRLKCGPLLGDIVRHMKDKAEGRISQRLWLYSAHDTTLANLMQCLGVYDGVLPAYTSTLIFELFKEQEDHYVSLSYRTPTSFRALGLQGCNCPCSFQDFQDITRSVIPIDWEKECRQN